MSDTLIRIKRLVIAQRVEFTLKAELERLRDGLAVENILESLINANAIKKVIRSRAVTRRARHEQLYIIESPTFDGVWINTKGTFRVHAGVEVFYVVVSSKLAT